MNPDRQFHRIARDGFSYEYGSMTTLDEGVVFRTGAELRAWFLPTVSSKGNSQLCSADTAADFVRGMLKHYGIRPPWPLNEGNRSREAYPEPRCIETQLLLEKLAIEFLQEMLAAGHCDKVPESMAKLRLELHRTWLAQIDASLLGNYPEFILEKYFLKEGASRAVGNEWLGDDPAVRNRDHMSSFGVIQPPELIKEEDIDRTKVLYGGDSHLLANLKPKSKPKRKAGGGAGDEAEAEAAVNVLVVPIVEEGRYSNGATRMIRMAGTVPGLHHAVVKAKMTIASASELAASGREECMSRVVLGWDKEEVKIAAEWLQKIVDMAAMIEEKARVAKVEKRHQAYLKKLPLRTFPAPDDCTIVGKYQLQCAEIEREWPHDAAKMWLAVRPTKTQGLFEADFNLGVLEGVMLLSGDQAVLKKRSDELGWYDEEWEDEEEDEEKEDEEKEDEEKEDEQKEDEQKEDEQKEDEQKEDEDDEAEELEQPISEKKRKSTEQDAGSSKKAKTVEDKASVDDTTVVPAQPTTPLRFYTRSMGRETGEGELQPWPLDGTITFTDDRFVAFTGYSNMEFVGDHIPYSGQKISDAPGRARHSWRSFQVEYLY